MTNEQRIRNNISTTEKLAEYLIVYNDYNGKYYTSDGTAFYVEKEAIEYEVEWLQSESDK
jgi:hypothetical protein